MRQLIYAFLQGQVSEPTNGFYIHTSNSTNELRYSHYSGAMDTTRHIVVAKLYKGRFMKDLCAVNTFRPQNDKYKEAVSILKDTASLVSKFNVCDISYYDAEVAEMFVAETIECMVKEYNAIIKCFLSKGTQMPEIFEMAVAKYNAIMAYCDATSSSTPHGMVSIAKAKYKYDDITSIDFKN